MSAGRTDRPDFIRIKEEGKIGFGSRQIIILPFGGAEVTDISVLYVCN